MLRSSLVLAGLLAGGHNAYAQQTTVGGQLQQIPPVSVPQRTAPVIRIERPSPSADAEAGGASIRVDALRVTGATVFPEAELVAATGFTPGGNLTLAELHNAAARITSFYNSPT